MQNEEPGSRLTQKRYDRVAPFYDFFETPVERYLFGAWRGKVMERIVGDRVLEIGVGTGKNIPHYPRNMHITAMDLSARMLKRAQRRLSTYDREMALLLMDVQHLAFPDKVFDMVFATFVFCSIPDPVMGLMEMRRVCKPTGKLLLLEHMRPGNPIMGLIFDLLNPFVVRLTGANINRRTMDNILAAGWTIQVEDRLQSDIVRLIEAKP